MTKPNVEQQPNGFYYQIPDYEPGLGKTANITVQMGAMASRLVQEERTRTHHPDGRAENVSEHSHMLSKIAPEIAAEMYPELDRGLIALYTSAHDDVEAYVLDTATDKIDAQGRIDKAQREARGLEQLLKEHAHMPAYCRTVHEYEAQQIPEARFVRVVDKITVLLIHIPNAGKIIQENYTFDQALENTRNTAQRLLNEYPEYEELIALRTELSHHLAHQYLAG